MGTRVYSRNGGSGAQVWNDGCSFSFYKIPDGYFIHSLFTKGNMRRKGYGLTLLRRVTKWADKIGVKLFLRCAPFSVEGGCLSVEDTRRFYEKAGFRATEERQYGIPMVYEPRS